MYMKRKYKQKKLTITYAFINQNLFIGTHLLVTYFNTATSKEK